MTKEELTIPTSRELLERELSTATLARTWRGFEIHFVRKATAPNVVLEANRISTMAFSLDTLDGDIYDETYQYIVVYDRENGEVVSFYRYMLCKNAIIGKHDIRLSTNSYFVFSDEFIQKVLPVTIELGRSVVNKLAKNAENGLEAVWKGLGVLVYEYHQHPKAERIEYLFGKFSIQWNIYEPAHRDMILFLFKKHFPPLCGADREIYIQPRFEFETKLNFEEAMQKMTGTAYKDDRKILLQHLQDIKLPMPKLAESYANLLGKGLKSFGTVFNEHLKSWETAILARIDEVHPSYVSRFVDGYASTNEKLF